MLIEKRKIQKREENHLGWPDNYYMEMDPAVRKNILDQKIQEDGSEELLKIQALFEQRYAVNRKQEYQDRFMKACLDLQYISGRLSKPFTLRTNKKLTGEVAHALCLDREEEFGTDHLYDELCHLLKMYITISMNDSSYRSLALNLIKMKDEDCRQKIAHDLENFSVEIPKAMEKESEFALFQKAAADVQKEYLG